MKIINRWLLVFSLMLLTACATVQPAPTAPSVATSSAPIPAATLSPTSSAQRPADLAATSTEFPGALSAALAASGDATYLVLGMDDQLLVARSLAGAPFSVPIQANLGTSAFVMWIERPAIVATAPDRVSVSWLDKSDDQQTSVWLASSSDAGQSFAAGQRQASVTEGETAMVNLAGERDSPPVLAWLQDGNLAFARATAADGLPEVQAIDEQVCDCCQPQPLVRGDTVTIAFRNLERDAQSRDIRDIFVIASADGGRSFGSPVRVSDAHWYLNACPISGPALATDGERMYVSWMDGRNASDSDQQRNDLWLAISADGGQTFGPNQRLNPDDDMSNGQPTLVVGPADELHLSWAARDRSGQQIYYARSDDHGQTFSAPQVVVHGGEAGHKRPEMPALAIDAAGRITLAWVDERGAQVAQWNSR